LFACAGAVLFASAALGGCGDEGSTALGSSQPSNLTEVGSLSAAGVTVTFYSASVNGKSHIGIRENGSAFAKSSPIAALVAQGLTTQEIYLALAPDGAAAPPALVAAQADEAVVLHRSADIRHVTVDKSAVVPKSLAACETRLFSDLAPPYGFRWSAGPSGTFSNAAYEGLNETTFWVLLGACNESTVPVDLYGMAEATWYYFVPIETWIATMGAYQYYNWYWILYQTEPCSAPFGCLRGAAYVQQGTPEGSSALYDIVTANAVYAGPPAQ
jgi:hypothetical protein